MKTVWIFKILENNWKKNLTGAEKTLHFLCNQLLQNHLRLECLFAFSGHFHHEAPVPTRMLPVVFPLRAKGRTVLCDTAEALESTDSSHTALSSVRDIFSFVDLEFIRISFFIKESIKSYWIGIFLWFLDWDDKTRCFCAAELLVQGESWLTW